MQLQVVISGHAKFLDQVVGGGVSSSDVLVTVNQMQSRGIIEHYAIGGAVGATFYLEPMSTFDVDIFVAFHAEQGKLPVSTQPIFDYLTARDGVVAGEYIVIGGWPIQFLPPTGPLVEEALAQAVKREVEATETYVLPPNTSRRLHYKLGVRRTKLDCSSSSRLARSMTRCFRKYLRDSTLSTIGTNSNDSFWEMYRE